MTMAETHLETELVAAGLPVPPRFPSQPVLFADRLKAARIAAGLTQAGAAEQVGKTQAQWSLMESGHWSPLVAYRRSKKRYQNDLCLIGAIAAAVNSTVENLTGEERC